MHCIRVIYNPCICICLVVYPSHHSMIKLINHEAQYQYALCCLMPCDILSTCWKRSVFMYECTCKGYYLLAEPCNRVMQFLFWKLPYWTIFTLRWEFNIFSQESRVSTGGSYFPRRVVFSQEGRIFQEGCIFPGWSYYTTILGKYDHPVKIRL